MQWDRYGNPETIATKDFGGDNEAGVADDGVFNNLFPASDVSSPEIRLDISYTFGF